MEFFIGCQINLIHFEKNKITDNSKGMESHCFGYILEGHARFEGEQKTIMVDPGDLIYIPKGERYFSYWETDPEILFYSMPYECYETQEYYPLQKVSGLDRELFDEMFYLSQHDCYKMMGKFYEFYGETLKKMKKGTAEKRTVRIRPALEFLKLNAESPVSVEQLAGLCHMSQPTFYAEFKKVTGYSPIDYKNRLRCKEAVSYLKKTDETVEAISEKLGFSSASYLRRQLKQFAGKTPKEIRKEESLQI
ncbi:MAG: AraC family transcriptional regulator [Ruminococcaceae bacterium]|nr:AraC family transcriptional regulator [Oscillospiraceae bacterium]